LLKRERVSSCRTRRVISLLREPEKREKKKQTACQPVVARNPRHGKGCSKTFRLTSSANSKSPSNFLLHLTPVAKTSSTVAASIHENRMAGAAVRVSPSLSLSPEPSLTSPRKTLARAARQTERETEEERRNRHARVHRKGKKSGRLTRTQPTSRARETPICCVYMIYVYICMCTRRSTRNGNAQLDSWTSCAVTARSEATPSLPLAAPLEARARPARWLVGSRRISVLEAARGEGGRWRALLARLFPSLDVHLFGCLRRGCTAASQYLQLLVHLPTYLSDVARGFDGEKGRKRVAGNSSEDTREKSSPILPKRSRQFGLIDQSFFFPFSSLRLPLPLLFSPVTLLY